MVPILFHFSTVRALWPSHLTPGTSAFSLYVRHCDHDHHYFCSPSDVRLTYRGDLFLSFLHLPHLSLVFSPLRMPSWDFLSLTSLSCGCPLLGFLFPPPYQVYIISSTLSGVHNFLSWDFYFIIRLTSLLWVPFYVIIVRLAPASALLGFIISLYYFPARSCECPCRVCNFPARSCECPYRVCNNFPARSCECPYRVCYFPSRSCECPYRVCYLFSAPRFPCGCPRVISSGQFLLCRRGHSSPAGPTYLSPAFLGDGC